VEPQKVDKQQKPVRSAEASASKQLKRDNKFVVLGFLSISIFIGLVCVGK